MQRITLEFEGLTPQELQRIQDTIHILHKRDVFNMKNGKVILHYDYEGTLQEIGFEYKRWKRRKLDRH